MSGYLVVFDAAGCTCPPEDPHPVAAHDDGFGCTIPGCGCLAGFSFEPEAGS